MRIRSIHLRNFRAHAEAQLSFAPGINVLYGRNGAGKTNILEAIYYVCLSRSFLTHLDAQALRWGTPFFEVDAHFTTLRRPEVQVRLLFDPQAGKHITVNRASVSRISEFVGILPLVLLSPADMALGEGGPSERRHYLDGVLSQASPRYLRHLLQYRRVLRQRNELLFQLRQGRFAGESELLLDTWTQELASAGAAVLAARAGFLTQFRPHLLEAYALLGGASETPDVQYASSDAAAPDAEGAAAPPLEERLRAVSRRERKAGRTLVGPHLDDLRLLLGGGELRKHASQGQIRTFVTALRLAQVTYFRASLAEEPLLLLDDIFGSLDEERTERLLGYLSAPDAPQSVLTTTSLRLLEPHLDLSAAENKAQEIA